MPLQQPDEDEEFLWESCLVVGVKPGECVNQADRDLSNFAEVLEASECVGNELKEGAGSVWMSSLDGDGDGDSQDGPVTSCLGSPTGS